MTVTKNRNLSQSQNVACKFNGRIIYIYIFGAADDCCHLSGILEDNAEATLQRYRGHHCGDKQRIALIVWFELLTVLFVLFFLLFLGGVGCQSHYNIKHMTGKLFTLFTVLPK